VTRAAKGCERLSTQEKDAIYARLGEPLTADERVPAELRRLAEDARVTVRRGGAPARGRSVVCWMQRAQRGLAVRRAAKKHPRMKSAADAFLDELIVWRELSVNFVRYQPECDLTACADNWARLTIAKHDTKRYIEQMHSLAR